MADYRNLKLDHTVRVKKDDIITQIHSYDLDLRSNHIYLMGSENYTMGSEETEEKGVEFTMANRFVRNLNLCMRINYKKSILIHMKTCGGSWVEGMAIYDLIKTCPSAVTILSYTHARSMSSIILQAANKRVLLKNSYFMIHDGTDAFEGTDKAMKSYMKFNRPQSNTMLEIYAQAIKMSEGTMRNKTTQYLKRWMRGLMDKHEDVYFTAKDAVAIGFADKIFEGDWKDLTRYTAKQLER